jgi:hypothetical protein
VDPVPDPLLFFSGRTHAKSISLQHSHTGNSPLGSLLHVAGLEVHVEFMILLNAHDMTLEISDLADRSNNSIQFVIIYVSSQQPQGQCRYW